MPLRITSSVAVDESELCFTFHRASGPGGQNVNKVETAVELRFDVRNSPSLEDRVRANLARLAGRRLTKDGVLVLDASSHRSQERNRAEVVERLVAMLRAAAAPPPPKRRPTKPTKTAREKRLAAKKTRATHKANRSGPTRLPNDD